MSRENDVRKANYEGPCRREPAWLLLGTAHDVVNIALVHDHATLGTASLCAQLGAEVVDIDLAIPEFLHGL